jgi:hypothetical protein
MSGFEEGSGEVDTAKTVNNTASDISTQCNTSRHGNEVVAKRMVKKQQMQWSQEGAHSLLQTRTAVLKGELRGHFEDWYPELKTAPQTDTYEAPVKLAA